MDYLNMLFQQFHFLRPWGLLLSLLGVGLFFWLRHQNNHNSGWAKVIAPDLLALMIDNQSERTRGNALLWLLFWIIGSVAFAGPTWQKIPLPVLKSQQPLVVLFDLSPSMLVQDIKPDRLTRAKLKLIDLLKARTEGTTALVSYAGEAFVVSPLTDDTNTVANMVPALHPSIMPVPGSQTEQAVEQAITLIHNTGETSGDILVVSDGIDPEAADNINGLLRNEPDIHLSILGVGTAEGGPIPLPNGGFAKDQHGSILVPTLNESFLVKLAIRHKGLYAPLQTDDQDIQMLMDHFKPSADNTRQLDERTTDTWLDTGYCLVLVLLPLLLTTFRKGIVVCLILFLPVLTPNSAQAFEWQDLWLTKDQQAARAMEQDHPGEAQALFRNKAWKGAAAYKQGNFESAEQLFDGETASQLYNRGNALAKQSKLKEALAAYDKALQQSPDMDDAKFNKQLVEQLLKQQENKSSQQSGNNDQQQSDKNQKNKKNSSSADSGNGQGDKQPRDKQSQNNPNDSGSSGNGSEQNNQSGENPSKQDQQGSGSRDAQQQTGNQQQDQQQKQQQKGKTAEKSASNSQPQQQKEQDQGQEGKGLGLAEGDSQTEEEKQKMEQWLRKVPNDPGLFLRQKFNHQYQQRAMDNPRNLLSPQEKQQRW